MWRMRALFALAAISLLGQRALSDGCMMPSEKEWKRWRERATISEPMQKALIYFHDGIEDLIVSPSFSGPVADFAWVIPVPSRPKVEILRGAPFHELAKIAFPYPPGAMRDRLRESAKALPGSAGVQCEIVARRRDKVHRAETGQQCAAVINEAIGTGQRRLERID